MIRKRILRLTAALALVLACIPVLAAGGCAKPQGIRITVAEQYGLAYAPIQIMKEKGYLEIALQSRIKDGRPVTVEWVKLANTSAIREAMLADTLDVAFVGIPPFLIGLDQGTPWRLFTGLSECPLDLMVRADSNATLTTLAGNGKIALPQPGSIQHILLAMAAERQLGDAKTFDRQLVSMKHPDGMQALLSGQDLVAHFTAPPYNYLEADDAGARSILNGEEAMGEPFTFVAGVAEKAFCMDTLRYEAFMEALDQSFAFIESNPTETVSLLSESFELSLEKTDSYLYHRGIIFNKDIRGFDRFSAFMTSAGYLGRTYRKDEAIWGG